MPSPFEDGGTTKTIDVPDIQTEPPRRGASLSWIVVVAVALALLALLLIAIVALAG